MLSRSTQTNEPARCATLLPALCRLPQPLALLELGASAGLCLLPDRYAYSYNGRRLRPSGESFSDTVLFPCRANAVAPIPTRLPTIVWRAGLDLNPVDLRDDGEISWLENLVWPGQEDRAQRLRLAIRLARRDPPTVVQGNLLTDVPSLDGKAPSGITLVVYHSATLAYVGSKRAREQFAKSMAESDFVIELFAWRRRPRSGLCLNPSGTRAGSSLSPE